MSALDVASPGPADARWLTRIATLPTWTIPDRAHVVVVSPHPDDETLGVGGTLQRVIARGATIDLVAVTDGEASHPGVHGLGARRRRELDDALGRLAIRRSTTVHHLGVPDGAVAQHAETVSAAVRRLATPASVVLAPHADDGHADHEAAFAATRRGASDAEAPVWSYPVWAWQWHDPDAGALLAGGHRVPLSHDHLVRKRRAVAAHASQTTDELGPPTVPAHVLTRLLRHTEVLVPCV